jgi:3-dehydroquinate dehydratase type I
MIKKTSRRRQAPLLAIGKLPLVNNGAPRIVASIAAVPTRHSLTFHKRRGLDIVEARLDLFAGITPPLAANAAAACSSVLPTIVTARGQTQGGGWRGGEKKRAEVLLAALARADAVDVELDCAIARDVAAAAWRMKKTVILSAHFFDRTPSLGEMRYARHTAFQRGADVFKIAAQTDDADSLRRLAEFVLDDKQPVAVLGMGKLGALSRVMLPPLGSVFTFAHIGRPTAAGQMTLVQTAAAFARFGLSNKRSFS